MPEAEASVQDVGWVYREGEELPPVDIKETVAAVAETVREVPAAELAVDAVLAAGKPAAELPPLPPPAHESPNVTRLAIMASMGAIAIGIVTTGVMAYAAYSIMAAPFRVARYVIGGK